MSSFLKSLSVLTLVVAFTRATITIQTQNLIGNTTDTIHWTSSDLDSDPDSFSVELNHPEFRDNLALANNVPTANMAITFEMPDVDPGPEYSILFVENGNITNVIARTGQFFVIENDISGPHTGLVSPTLPPPTPSTSSSLATNTSVPSTATSSPVSSAVFTTPVSTSSGPATTPVVVVPNPGSTPSSDNSTVLNGNNPISGAKAVSTPA